ncbi:MAG: BUG/TctC family periplasmic protein, partial [uncultured Craurococcus sp.]
AAHPPCRARPRRRPARRACHRTTEWRIPQPPAADGDPLPARRGQRHPRPAAGPAHRRRHRPAHGAGEPLRRRRQYRHGCRRQGAARRLHAGDGVQHHRGEPVRLPLHALRPEAGPGAGRPGGAGAHRHRRRAEAEGAGPRGGHRHQPRPAGAAQPWHAGPRHHHPCLGRADGQHVRRQAHACALPRHRPRRDGLRRRRGGADLRPLVRRGAAGEGRPASGAGQPRRPGQPADAGRADRRPGGEPARLCRRQLGRRPRPRRRPARHPRPHRGRRPQGSRHARGQGRDGRPRHRSRLGRWPGPCPHHRGGQCPLGAGDPPRRYPRGM